MAPRVQDDKGRFRPDTQVLLTYIGSIVVT
jgi:hypothetical protein